VQDVINQANNINSKIFGYAPQAATPVVELVAQETKTITTPEILVQEKTTNNEIFGKHYALGDSGYEIIYLQELLVSQ
jgi:hypothetical protein